MSAAPATLSLRTPETERLFALLGEKNLRFVGGCVRNALLGEPPGDIDFATRLLPAEVTHRLEKDGIKVVPTGIDHGTVTAVVNGIPFEITTLRKDVATDGRRAVIAFTTLWEEDAARRDFTVNALYADRDGTVYDPLGTGLNDLRRRKIRFVGNADDRVQEDILRILRFIRFRAIYGTRAPDEDALRACIKYENKLGTLSRERVTSEFTKILTGPGAVKAVTLIKTHGLFRALIDKKTDTKRITYIEKVEKLYNSGNAPPKDVFFCARLLSLFPSARIALKKLSTVLILNKNIKRILEQSARIKFDTIRSDKADFRPLLYSFDADAVTCALLLRAATESFPVRRTLRLLRQVSDTQRPVFPVTGKDLTALGYPPDKELGKCLKTLERRWIRSGFTLTKEDLLSSVRRR